MSESDPHPPPTPPDDPDVESLLQRARSSVQEDVAASDRKRLEDAAVRDEEQVRELREAHRNLRMLLEVTRKLNSMAREDEVLDLILNFALETSGGDRAYILALDPKGQLQARASRTRDGGRAQPPETLMVSHSSLEDVFRHGRTLHVDDAAAHPDFMGRRSVQELSLKSIVCVPLGSPGRVTGALYVDSQSATASLGEDGRRLLEALASQASVALDRVIEHERLEAQNQSLREALGEVTQFDRILGRSPAMKRVFSVLDRVIRNPVTVHIHGETGTGKDLVAQAVHFNGPRRDKPFVAVNCGAVAQALLETELFGSVEGAFTDAKDRMGVIERADGGTLFLDEIGEIPQPLQVSLLRVLQEGTIRRVGDTNDRKVDVRLITATHKDLEREVAAGRLRQDFFFRINVVTISLPPLRDREDDVLLLAEEFLSGQREKLGRSDLVFSREAKRAMLDYAWPGNVRELMNRVERASALAETHVIGAEDLTLTAAVERAGVQIPNGGSLKEILREVEIQVIERALKENDQVMAKAARQLGMSRQNLYARMKTLEQYLGRK